MWGDNQGVQDNYDVRKAPFAPPPLGTPLYLDITLARLLYVSVFVRFVVSVFFWGGGYAKVLQGGPPTKIRSTVIAIKILENVGVGG